MSPSGGLVTFIVGSTDRAAGRRARGKGAAGAPAPGAPAQSQPAAQWSFRWSGVQPESLVPAGRAEPDLTLTLSPEDAALVLAGELAPSVAFMQGRLKTAGNNALLLDLLRWTATDEFQKARAAWRSHPELGPQGPPAG